MKLLFIFALTASANAAEWCDIKDLKTQEVLWAYSFVDGSACNQSRFNGAFGDKAQTVHVVNSRKKTEMELKEKAAADRLTRLKSQCSVEAGITKDMCEALVEK